MNKGFYIASRESDCWGFSFALVYNTADKDFQLAIMFFNLMVAIGYTFG